MSLRLVFLFSLLAVSLRNVRAVSAEEKQKIRAGTFRLVMECSAELDINIDDIKKTKESGHFDTLDHCLMACVFKKGKVIDDKGMYDFDKAAQFPKKIFSDESDQKKGLEIVTNCKSVNVQDVTDGEKGCERAGLLLECFSQFKDMFKD